MVLFGSFMRKKIQSLGLVKRRDLKITAEFQVRTLKNKRKTRGQVLALPKLASFQKNLDCIKKSATTLFAQQREVNPLWRNTNHWVCHVSNFFTHRVQHALINCQAWPEHMNKTENNEQTNKQLRYYKQNPRSSYILNKLTLQ